MIDALDELAGLLTDTPLSGRELATLPVLETGEVALAIDATPATALEDWGVLRARLDATGRWPLVTCDWDGSLTFEDRLRNADAFSRFYYEEEPNASDVRPQAILERSAAVDVDAFVAGLIRQAASYLDEDPEMIDYEFDATAECCAEVPDRADAPREGGLDAIDRWLLDWELSNGATPDLEMSRPPFFDPENAFLLLMPTMSGWESLAYLNWFGTSDFGSDHYVALGKSWENRFGAELVCHFGTMLQCFVERPPTDPIAAWEIAREHALAGPCTLAPQGIPLRHYAQAIVGYDRWFLHDRP